MPNIAPSGTSVTRSVPRSYTLHKSDFGFTDSDGNGFKAVVFTTLPGAGTLYFDSNGALGSGVSAVTVGQTISAADILAGKLNYVAPAGVSGANYASFTFQVQDDGGTGGGGVDTDQSPNTLTFDLVASDATPATFGSLIDLASLSAADGFRIQGEEANDLAGASVSSAGDVNGDGFADILIAAYGNDSGGSSSGAAYVIFGKASGFGTLIDLTGLSAADGFKIQGRAGDYAGISVSSAGDVNGDGFADIIVGAERNSSGGFWAGAAYLIFGKSAGFGNLIDLTALAAADGFKIQGDAGFDFAGRSVSSAGDVNGDGFADIIVGAFNNGGGSGAGAAYVIFGKASGFGTLIDLAGLSAADGFKIQGDLDNDHAGYSVSSAGDVNGDGFADILVGAYGNDSGGDSAGAGYVIFGKSGGFGSLLDLTGFSAADGFKIQGDLAGDFAGHRVSSAGDVNGDGFADIIVGADRNDSGGDNAGAAYVIFGRAAGPGGFGTLIDLSGLSGADGFVIQGDSASDSAGIGVSSAGDVNGDGFADILVGAPGDDGGGTDAGAAYVIFGKSGGFGGLIDLANLSAADGFKIEGPVNAVTGRSVSSGGDVNGDGFADILVGAKSDSSGGSNAGAAYVIFGRANPVVNAGPTVSGTGADPTYFEDTPGQAVFSAFSASPVEAGQNLKGFTFTLTNVTDGADEYVNFDNLSLTLTNGNSATSISGFTVSVSLAGSVATVTATSASGVSAASFSSLVGALSYTNIGQTPSTADRVFTLTSVTDTGGTANGGADTVAPGIISTIHVQAVNDTPNASLGGAISIIEDATNAPLGGMSIFDLDSGSADIAVTFHVDHGIIDLDTNVIGGFAAGDVTGNGSDTVIVLASQAEINAVLAAANGIAYSPTADYSGNDALTVTTNDLGNTGTDPGLSGDNTSEEDVSTRTISIGAINDAPVVDLNTGTLGIDDAGVYTEGGAAAAIGAAITITDAEAGDTLSRAEIVIGDVEAGDQLFTTGSLPSGISVDTVNSTDTSLILIGFGSRADYATALGQVRFRSASDDPTAGGTHGSRSISVSAFDGTDISLPATMALSITAVDDAAIAQPDAVSTDEATVKTGSVFANNGSGTDTDPDTALVVTAVNGTGSVGVQIALASGALLTLNADGTYSYDPNHVFDVTPAPGSGASNTPAHDSFTYAVNGITTTVSLTINGLDTNDTLLGTSGNDTSSGGVGDDRYFVDQTGDLVLEIAGQGYDRVLASVDYVLAAGSEIEKLTTDNNFATTPINLTGNELGQYLFGNAGANSLDGAGGADVMVGLGGDDRYYVDTAADRVIEAAGEGYDRVLAAVSWTLQADSYVDKITTIDNLATTAINLTGNNVSQYIFGNAGANTLDGGGGGDVLVGLEGDDRYIIRNSADRVIEEAAGGNDRVLAGASFVLQPGSEVETLSTIDNLGTTAIDLTGNELGQYLFGNAGANVLDGKLGNDVLYGLGGSDTFQFTTVPGANNVDRIADFVTGVDRIALDDFIFTGLQTGTLNANAFHVGSAAHDADDKIIYNQTTGALYFDYDGNGHGAAVQFANLNGAPILAASDFMVI